MSTAAYEMQAHSFKALGHASRLAMVELMRNGAICSCEIEPVLGISQSSVAKHLAVLRDSGLVSSYRDGSRVMCQVADTRVLAAIDAIRAATQARLAAATQSFAALEPDLLVNWRTDTGGAITFPPEARMEYRTALVDEYGQFMKEKAG